MPCKGSCNTAAILGRTIDNQHLGAQGKLEMYSASTIHGTDKASASETEGPQAPTALCCKGQVPYKVQSSRMPHVELSLLSASGQALKF